MKKNTIILAVSFGASYRKYGELSFGAIEKAAARAFPECGVRRAFASRRIINILKERDGLEIDHVKQAVEKALEEGVANLILQPTFLIYGQEYMDLCTGLQIYNNRSAILHIMDTDKCTQLQFYKNKSGLNRMDTDGRRGTVSGCCTNIIIGKPLLAENADLQAAVKAVTNRLNAYDDGKTAVCLMGHGTDTGADEIYTRLQDILAETGHKNYYIGTMNTKPALEDILAALKTNPSYQKAILYPFMLTAGAHAHREMAGNGKDAWKTVLEEAGYETSCLMEGIGQLPAVWDIYINHAREALQLIR